MSDKPTHFEWMKAAREIRDSHPQPPEPGSLSAELAAELGAAKGDDPLNDRADEAQSWCELIMKNEGRERLLAQYNSNGSDWLHNRLLGVLDDCLEYNPSDKPLFCHTALGHNFEPDHGMYGGPPGIGFGTGLGLSEPVFNSGGVVLGVMASHPMVPTAYTSKLNPLDHLGWMKFDKVRLHKMCDWHIAKNCENRRRFVLAFPVANCLVYYVTCYPCANELPNRIR